MFTASLFIIVRIYTAQISIKGWRVWQITECYSVVTRKKESEVTQSCPTLCDPVDCSPPGSSIHGILQARILEWVAISFSRGCSRPRDRTWSPALEADALTSEPPGKPKSTGVGGLSLLQQIFLNQESNWGLLHCREILYQLSYQGSPKRYTISSQ